MALEASVELMKYRLLFVRPDSRKVLVLDFQGEFRLPSVRIPMGKRRVEQLCKTIRNTWGLHVLILDFLPAQAASSECVVAELLLPVPSPELRAIAVEEIPYSELSENQRTYLEQIQSSDRTSPFCRVGWIEEAIAWVQAATQSRLASRLGIEQLNAGGPFSLIRFSMENGQRYWLKATGERNAHEHSITLSLCRLCPENLPALIATKPDWNAWLMSGDAFPIATSPSDPAILLRWLGGVVESMAELQATTEPNIEELIHAGAFNQDLSFYKEHSERLFDAIDEAMRLQTSTKVPPIAWARLRELRAIFEAICDRIEDLDLPKTIVHGDLNIRNILCGKKRSLFIDWSEAYIGNPLISLQHLLLLNQVENPGTRAYIDRNLRERYLSIWAAKTHSRAIDLGFAYMPILAAASTLFGRADWLTEDYRNRPFHMAYIRSLARHMDRAVRVLE